MAFLDVSFILVDHNNWYFPGGSHIIVGLDLERGRASIKAALKFS
jgi:hypothetical protein